MKFETRVRPTSPLSALQCFCFFCPSLCYCFAVDNCATFVATGRFGAGPYGRDATTPLPYCTVTVSPVLMFASLSTWPLGHWISTVSALPARPSPKVATNSLCDR